MCHLVLLLRGELDAWEEEDRVLHTVRSCSSVRAKRYIHLVEHIYDLCHSLLIHCIRVKTFYLPSEIFEGRCICRRWDWKRRIAVPVRLGLRLSLGDGRHGSFADEGR